MSVEIIAEYDASSMGATRTHFVFPLKPKGAYDKANVPDITGGVYVRKGVDIPDVVVIRLQK